MQIHEITLREAEWQPLDPKKIMATARPTRFNYGTPPVSPRVGTELPTDPALKAKQDALSAQQAQHQQQSANALNTMKANTVAVNKVATAPKTLASATTNPNPGANAFGQMAQQLAPQAPTIPVGPTQSSTQGTITPTATGVVHTASERNPNPRTEPMGAQQKWDIEFRKLQNQYPGRTPQQYQQAMLQRVGTARPNGTPASQDAPAPQAAAIAQPGTTIKPVSRPVQPASAATTQYPPITLGSGPKAQVYVNKGRGYIDSKTGKPMPPSIVKAMGI